MPKTKNSYSKGLNRDASRSKTDPSSYFDALNIKIVTQDGLSTGSLENENGNSLSFVVPDIPAEINTQFIDGTPAPVPAQNDLKIIGWTTLEQEIILFTTNETSTSSLGSVGQIWVLEYDEDTGTIPGILPGNLLDPTVHLRYNHKLSFSTAFRIEAVGRYENEGTRRVYWTDFNSPLRVINLASDPLPRTVTPTYPLGLITVINPANLDIKPDTTFGRSTPISVGKGALPAAGKVQYAYRLISKDGAETIVSPASELVSLTKATPNTGDIPDYEGDPTNTGDFKSVTFEITNIDTNYDVIEHIAILYIDKDSPSIFKFGEESIPSKGSANPSLPSNNDIFDNRLRVTLTGNEDRIYLTEVEYSRINIGFDACKTIDAKDNRLVAGNIKTAISEISNDIFDARVYRFDASRTAKIDDIDRGQATINGASPDWNIDEEHDAINPFNIENPTQNPDWLSKHQYKYQADGTTIGGTGRDLSYEFITSDMVVDNADSSNPSISHIRNAPFVNVKPVAGEWPNMANPIKEATTMGYMRGEVYRFGIEFYDLKGRPTFVKWIGDIKFPDPTHGQDYKVGDTGSLTAGDMSVYSLGIQFNIDLSSVQGLVSGFQIVRAERTDADKTRLGTGTNLIPVDKIDENASDYSEDTLFESVKNVHSESVGIYELKLSGQEDQTDRFVIPDCPGIRAHGSTDTNFKNTRNANILLSPVSTFRADTGFEFREGDYLKTYGYYRAVATQYVKWQTDSSNNDLKRQGWVWRCRDFQMVSHISTSVANPVYESFKINFLNHLADGEIVGKNSSKLPSGISGNKFLNNSYGVVTTGNSAEESPLGMGRDTCLLELAVSNLNGHVSAASMGWNNAQPSNFSADADGDGEYYVNEGHTFKELAYCREVESQYGGNTYEVRSKQQYISTGHYQPVRRVGGLSTSNLFNVFGGDAYVNYWDKEYLQQYLNDEYQNQEGQWEGPKEYKESVAILFPTESDINVDLTYGTTFARDRKGDDYSNYIETVNRVHNDVYNQENNAATKFFAKDFLLSTNEIFPHRLWASDKKIDGEFLDSWRSFKDTNFIEVEGHYGPINKVINFQDKLLFYQNRAFGIGSINERSMIQDTNGVQVAVGTGTVLDHFRYISNSTGSFHQFSVVASGNSIYHFDVYLSKLYKYGQGGAAPLSDVEGMSTFFQDEVQREIIDTDLTLRSGVNNESVGVHAIYDQVQNTAIFTFLRNDTTVGNPDFTISYNEALGSFESFHSYKPNLYLRANGRILSVDKSSPDTAYLHDSGAKGQYYDKPVEPSYITLLISPNVDIPKIFNNIEYNSEIFLKDANGDYTISQHLETLSSLEYYNDYQSSGVIPLIVGTDIKRRMRHWRHTMIRDQSSTNQRARFRDYCVYLKLSFDNNNDKRLVLHDIITSYTPARD